MYNEGLREVYPSLKLSSTHYNLYYNSSRWFERVVIVLTTLYGNRYDKEIRCLVTNSARAIKIDATEETNWVSIRTDEVSAMVFEKFVKLSLEGSPSLRISKGELIQLLGVLRHEHDKIRYTV